MTLPEPIASLFREGRLRVCMLIRVWETLAHCVHSSARRRQ